jgi:hypothetical protein
MRGACLEIVGDRDGARRLDRAPGCLSRATRVAPIAALAVDRGSRRNRGHWIDARDVLNRYAQLILHTATQCRRLGRPADQDDALDVLVAVAVVLEYLAAERDRLPDQARVAETQKRDSPEIKALEAAIAEW